MAYDPALFRLSLLFLFTHPTIFLKILLKTQRHSHFTVISLSSSYYFTPGNSNVIAERKNPIKDSSTIKLETELKTSLDCTDVYVLPHPEIFLAVKQQKAQKQIHMKYQRSSALWYEALRFENSTIERKIRRKKTFFFDESCVNSWFCFSKWWNISCSTPPVFHNAFFFY